MRYDTNSMNKLVVAIAFMFATIAIALSLTTSDVAQAAKCGGVEVAYLECDTKNSGDAVESSPLWAILTMVLNIMIGGVAIAAVGGIVYAAIMYASAQDNASQVQEAKNIIRNVVIGLVMFLLMWAGLQYLIPGGIF